MSCTRRFDDSNSALAVVIFSVTSFSWSRYRSMVGRSTHVEPQPVKPLGRHDLLEPRVLLGEVAEDLLGSGFLRSLSGTAASASATLSSSTSCSTVELMIAWS
jgi:hypothetical protein